MSDESFINYVKCCMTIRAKWGCSCFDSNYSGVQISWPRIFWDGSLGNNHNQPILANLYLLTDLHGDEANFLLVGKGTVSQCNLPSISRV